MEEFCPRVWNGQDTVETSKFVDDGRYQWVNICKEEKKPGRWVRVLFSDSERLHQQGDISGKTSRSVGKPLLSVCGLQVQKPSGWQEGAWCEWVASIVGLRTGIRILNSCWRAMSKAGMWHDVLSLATEWEPAAEQKRRPGRSWLHRQVSWCSPARVLATWRWGGVDKPEDNLLLG
jgi:hypothetical protein